MSSPVNLGKKKSVPGTPKTPGDKQESSLPRNMLVEPAKEFSSNFKATENSSLYSKGCEGVTPHTPTTPYHDLRSYPRRQFNCLEKELPRKALFQGSSPVPESSGKSSSNYKAPDRSQQNKLPEPISTPSTELRPFDSTRDGKVVMTPSTHPQAAPRQSHRPRSRLHNNPEMQLPRSVLFQQSPDESSDFSPAPSYGRE